MLRGFGTAKTSQVLGIDISSTTVKLLELSRNGDRYRVESYAVAPLPPEAVVEKNVNEIDVVGGLISDLVARSKTRAQQAVAAFSTKKIPTSMFVDSDASQLEASAQIGSPWVELHTGSFARAWSNPAKREKELMVLRQGMEVGLSLGLQVNAGHGINYENVSGARTLDQVTEFNIGHSIICRALEYGLQEAVSKMRHLLNS